VDLAKVIAATLALVNHNLGKQSIQVVDKRADGSFVTANSNELQQVFMNLVINASHAMPQGGSLEVGCGARDGKCLAWVKDSGTGIAPDVLPHIFEFAFTTKGDKGSGLGLSISRQIVEGHGGKISVASEVGKGTIFTIELPQTV
jgi:two-component system NtrC family sensor kinase